MATKSQVIGFISSILLTFAAIGLALKTDFSYSLKMNAIGTMAVVQAGIQLFMFMHVTEGKTGIWNVINIAFSVLMAIIVVVGSIWVLSSGHASY